jgi:DNA-binding NarL/FixJ family response regulator
VPSVFLVDDHDIARAGTRALLAGFDIVGEASNATDAIVGILERKPDVALIDVHIEEQRDGAKVVKAVKEVDPSIRCIALSVSQSRADVAALFAAGVDGYLTKRISQDELAAALQEAIAGGNPVSPEVAQYILEIDDVANQLELIERLTPREREVVMLIAQGYTYRQVASKLGMKVKTLETHMAHIFQKLGVATRAEVSFLAYETDLVDPRQGRD